jgi:GNAT superfamily N-acetyltransferase
MIEALNRENFDAALILFQQYQNFYETVNVDEEKNRLHLGRILTNEEFGKIFLIKDGEVYTGFATIYYTFSSTIAEQIAILNDLYIVKEHRRKGYGKQLMEHCASYLKTREIHLMRWITCKNNTGAQQLYHQFTQGTEWMIYSYRIE